MQSDNRKRKQDGVLFILTSFYIVCLFLPAYPIQLKMTVGQQEEIFTIDSYEDSGNVYIHLPTLMLKLGVGMSAEESRIKFITNNKFVVLDLDNKTISITENNITQPLFLQKPIQFTDNTIWMELNDAQKLLEKMSNIKLEISTPSPPEPTPIEDKTQTPVESRETNLIEPIEIVTNQNTSPSNQAKKITINKILIDPGHGGDDTGILFPSGKYEKDITLEIALEIEKQLKKKNKNYVLSRKEDILINNKNRSSLIEKEKIDFFISIHVESPSKNGSGLFIFTPQMNNTRAEQVCNSLADSIISSLNDKVVKKENIKKVSIPIYLTQNTQIPGIIIEIYPGMESNAEKENWSEFIGQKSNFTGIIVDSLEKIQSQINNENK